MQLPRLVIVDLETSGADPQRDRITEIAILTIENGELTNQWSSLINPGVPIPQRIQEFTGITDSMVADAPRFEVLADEIRARLSDALFIAHNARFDYNFLRASYERMGQVFASEVLCSVKLSRALNPKFPRHGLDALIERGGYEIASRHRAMDDAVIVWRFIRDSLTQHELPHFERCWSVAISGTAVPRLPTGNLEALPLSHGVFVFYNAEGSVLQVGRARNLRSQVLGVFTGARSDAKSKRLASQVYDVETHVCAGEIDAQLTELRLGGRLQAAKKNAVALAWRWHRDARVPSLLVLEDLCGTDPATWQNTFGCFRGENEARTVLRELAKRHQLCAHRLGLEVSPGGCSGLGLNRCLGVCIGKEPQARHDLRLMSALASFAPDAWPFAGPVTIGEHDDDVGMSATHVFSHWTYLGTARDERELHEVLSGPRRFDPAIHKLLVRWLATPDIACRMRPVVATTSADFPLQL